MDPSHLVHIRKRIDLSVFEKLTDELIREGLKLNRQTGEDPGDDEQGDDVDHTNDEVHLSNKVKLQIDATAADADIKFPTDLDLLNDSREKAEDLIDLA